MLGLEFEYGFIEDIKACATTEHGVKTQSGFLEYMVSLRAHSHSWRALLCLILKRKKKTHVYSNNENF